MKVLVTGGAVRLGAAIATAFASEGVELVIHYRSSASAARDLADDLGATCAPGDLATAEGCRAVAALAGPVDVLVNSAAGYASAPVEHVSAEAWDEMMALNARAPLLLTQALLPGLRASHLQGGGAVINIGDIAGDRPARGYLHYSVSKAALHHLTRALALELAPDVRVNAIAPGTVLPPDDLPRSALDRIHRTIPSGALGRAEDIASLAVYLALGAPYVTGQVWAVDGGRSVGGPLEEG